MEEQQHFSVRNATRAATAWAASPVGRLARVEVLVTLSCALLVVLVLLGSGRRANGRAAFRLAVWAALMLSYPAVSYTIGLMQSAPFRNELSVAWGCFLLLLLGCADGIAAYSLNDSDQQARTMLNQGLQIMYVLLLLLSYINSLPRQLRVVLFLLWGLSVSKLGMRIRSYLLAGRSRVLTVDNKLISGYMLREHEFGGANYDAISMKGYKYIVAGESEQEGRGDNTIVLSNDLVTVDKVWRCEGGLLSSGDASTRKRKDLCLSFALFKLLRRRLGGYPLHESGLNKTRDFVKVGLLDGPGSIDDHERMYRVIEVELGFLFDFFYARYPSPKETLIPDTVIFIAVVATSLFTLFCSTLLHYYIPPGNMNITTAHGFNFDIFLTRMIIILFILLESFQYFSLVFSDWHKVKMLSRYVREPSWQNHPIWDILLRFMCHVRLTRYWKNSVGQYSLLDACFRSDKSCISCAPLPKWIGVFLIRNTMTDQRNVPVTVKRAIYSFLKCGRIRNGEGALAQNQMLDQFSWAIAHERIVHSILIWHIATTMCDLQLGKTQADNSVIDNHQVATTLSNYCAYLVSSAPELLPDHSYDTQLLFDDVELSAQECLKGCRSTDDMYNKLMNLQPDRRAGVVILAEGAKLSAQLMQKVRDVRVRWKMLAELWVELLLSVAPSDNVTAHVQKLATGGELITHLWALLTHAGIVEKPINRHQQRAP